MPMFVVLFGVVVGAAYTAAGICFAQGNHGVALAVRSVHPIALALAVTPFVGYAAISLRHRKRTGYQTIILAAVIVTAFHLHWRYKEVFSSPSRWFIEFEAMYGVFLYCPLIIIFAGMLEVFLQTSGGRDQTKSD